MSAIIEGKLYRVTFETGKYEALDTETVTTVLEDTVVPDNDGLLGKVLDPKTMTGQDHGRLLGILTKHGYNSALDEIAVGPALDEKNNPLAGQMRVVNYKSRSSVY